MVSGLHCDGRIVVLLFFGLVHVSNYSLVLSTVVFAFPSDSCSPYSSINSASDSFRTPTWTVSPPQGIRKGRYTIS